MTGFGTPGTGGHYSLIVVLYTKDEEVHLALVQEEHMPVGVQERRVEDARSFVRKKLGLTDGEIHDIRLVTSLSPMYTFRTSVELPGGKFVPDVHVVR